MLRMFDEHKVRPVRSLDGLWELVTKPERIDSGRLPKRYMRKVHVPCAWETLPGLEAYRGTAWLRRKIAGCEGMATRLVFGGVSHTGTVYVDGKKIGRHYDAFTPFAITLPALSAGEHELVVEVDNSFGPHSALHIENDYYTYGGITRPAEIQYVAPAYIDKLFATPTLARNGWNLAVRVRVANCSNRPLRRTVAVRLEDRTLKLGTVTVPPRGEKEISGTLENLAVQPWTARTPRLYMLHAMMLEGGQVQDDLIDRVGFRQVLVKGKSILLNGEPLKLGGYNRHEDHPLHGNALPVEAMMTDLQIMRDLGCNFIRTSHYPNDMRFLDLCDELGFFVWEESHARVVDFKHPMFDEQIETSTREMVDWHHNHPSIIMWGCLNECDSKSRGGRAVFARVLRQLKRLDPSRPTTFASCHHQLDRCFGLVDIVSCNRYVGWYNGWPEDIEWSLKAMMKWLHSPASKGGAGKPMILSEFGGAAIYGCRNPNNAKWTEDYQARLLDDCLRVYMNTPGIVGVAIWQFCDVRVTANWWMTRARTMNNKGTVDEYRRRKMAYEVVKRHFTRGRLS